MKVQVNKYVCMEITDTSARKCPYFKCQEKLELAKWGKTWKDKKRKKSE